MGGVMENGTATGAVRALEPSMKPLVLPELVVKAALGGKTIKTETEVTLTFEGESAVMHPEDWELVTRAAKKLRPRLEMVRKRNVTAILELAGYAHQYLCEEMFTPGLLRVLYLPSMVKSNAFWRCAVPAVSMNARGRVLAHLAAAVKTPRACLVYDVIVVQLGHDPATFQAIKLFKEMGKKIVFEMDDDLFAQESWHGAYEHYQTERVQAELKAMLATADAVTVTTEYLKERYSQYAKRVQVIPNWLPLANWPKTEPHGTNEFRVLWAGSPSHFGDLQMVGPALWAFAYSHQNVRLVFFGREPVGPSELIKSQVVCLPWCEFEEYPVSLARIKADVAIAPLADVPFNKAKSNLKVLEYWGCGYPVIASDVGPYREMGKRYLDRGLFLCSNEAQWLGRLNEFYNGPKLQTAQAQHGKEAVCDYDVDRHAHEIEEFFLGL